MHECPHPECSAMIPSRLFACKRHWFQVPLSIRSRIWAEYGREPGSPAHVAAMKDGVAALQQAADRRL